VLKISEINLKNSAYRIAPNNAPVEMMEIPLKGIGHPDRFASSLREESRALELIK
jgi:S-adenosylmethionine synthetase